MKNIKGIVLDLDDTLYPQESFKKSGFRVVAQWLDRISDCKEAVVFSELCSIMKEKGASYPRIFDDLVMKLNLDPDLVPRMVDVFRSHDPEIQCYEGVLEMLERLGRTYRTGILTDGVLAVQEKKIQVLGLNRKVEAVLCSEIMGLNKPARQLFAWFEDRFVLSGKDLIYVGDNPQKDFIGARARGWKTIRVLTGEYTDVEPSAAFEADIILISASEIPTLLESGQKRGHLVVNQRGVI